MTLDPRTPVLVGAGTATQRSDDPAAGTDALGLMRLALDAAVADAGGSAAALLDRVDEILVPEGIWSTRDPGRLVLDGRSPDARSVLVAVGVLQQSAFTRAATAIAEGRADVVIVCGGEAKFRSLRAQIAGVEPPPGIDAPGGTPDLVIAPDTDLHEPVEIDRLLASPTHQYAVMESAIGHDAGRTPAQHARAVAELVAAFSAVAARNPDAWNQRAVTADEVLAAPLVTEPYTKPACSQWNVDQAAAFVLCSAEVAAAHGIAADRWVFPTGAAESNLMVPLTRRADLHRSPAAAAVGDALAQVAGRPLHRLDHLEIYSCFPAAVEIQCREFGIDPADAPPLTVTGGMHFAGGPLNSFTLQALARLVPMLRAEPGATALVSSISGFVTKVGGGLWSSAPAAAGFRAFDVTARAAATTATRDVDPDHEGEAVVVGATIGHRGGEPVEGVVVADTPDGRRAVAFSGDPDVIGALRVGDPVGRSAVVHGPSLIGLD